MLTKAVGLLTVLVYALFYNRLSESWWSVLIGGIIVGSLTYFGRELARRDGIKSQLQRNEDARAVSNAIINEDEDSITEFRLFLRPFQVEGKLATKNPDYSFFPSIDRFTRTSRLDFEALLASAIESSGTLIAFGNPGEHVGSGRFTASEEEWQEQFKKLAHRAKSIMIIPSSRPGTRWEVQWVKDIGLLRKCIFVMPPRPDPDTLNIMSAWAVTRNELLEIGVQVPEYQDSGKLFTIDNTGHVVFSVALYQLTISALCEKISQFENSALQKA